MQGHNDMIYGHVSARTENPQEYWIKGSGIGLEEGDAEDIVLIDLTARRGWQTQTPQRVSDS